MSPAASADGGPRIMPFPMALHYEAPAAPAIVRYGEALIDGRIIGQRCTGECGLVYVPPRDYCPIDVIKLIERATTSSSATTAPWSTSPS